MNSGARAITGTVILAIAAALVILGPRLGPDRVDGTALVDWPEPPAVGACLNLPERGAVETVPCERAHDAEVTRSWAATDSALAASPAIWMDRACTEAAADYVGRAPGTTPNGVGPGVSWWRAADLAYATFDIGAPDDQRAGDVGWLACIVRPAIPARYVDSVRGSAASDLDVRGVPEAYRACLDHYGNAASCTLPHESEVIAIGTYVTDIELGDFQPGQRYGWEFGGADDTSGDAVGDPRDQPGDSTDDAVSSLDQIAQRQAERAEQMTRGQLMADRTLAWRQGAATLAAMCLDLPTGLLPDTAHTGATVGLSGSMQALQLAEGGTALAVLEAGIGPQTALRLDTVAGFEAVTGACAITAPDGYQLTRSVLGWHGDTLPLIPG